MATYLKVSATDTKDVQLMPFHIDYNGKAQINQYFESIVRTNDKDMTSSFRGRPLQGEKIEVPHGYTGLIVKESQKAVTEDEDRHLTGVKKFQQFTYWNLDKRPSPDDKLQQAMDWIRLAKVLHSPVDTEDINSQKSVVEK